MCWSREASAIFGTLGLIVTIDSIRMYRKGTIKHVTPIFVYGLYTTMEWFQFIQYQVGFETCNASNSFLTLIAHILIWIQPIILNLHSLNVCNEKDKSLMRYSTFLAILAFVVSSYALSIGYQQSLKGTFPTTNERIHNLGSELCTKEDGIHFSWFFPYDSLDGYRPMGFTWITVATLPHFFRSGGLDRNDWFGSGKAYGSVILLGWFVTRWMVGSFFHAHWSFWCLHSVSYCFAPYFVWYIIDPIFKLSLEPKKSQ